MLTWPLCPIPILRTPSYKSQYTQAVTAETLPS